MRTGGHRRDVRASALWGSGKRGTGSRSNALWGSGKRRTALLATLVLTLVVPLGASAVPGPKAVQAFVAPGLLTSAQSKPTDTFSVIVQGKGGNQAAHAVADVLGTSMKVAKTFNSIDGVAIDLTGTQILALAGDKHVTAITPDARMRSDAFSPEKWPYVTAVQKYWAHGVSPAAPAATIAIVDSGIDTSRPEFAGRIAAAVNLSSLPGNSAGDGRGHGTFVAGMAAANMGARSGAAPSAKLVSLDVMDDQGMAKTSDVIAAADWILANKAKYGIRVANFSLHSASANGFMYDPLDKAVERLWFNNVVVVAAAGNYGSGNGPSGVPFAPGNDPFVITVGATDTGKSVSTNDDVTAPWSAYGYTLDGFAKPELSAPGRYMVGPVPTTSTLYSERADHIVDPGYVELSGHLVLGTDRQRHRRPDPGQASGLHAEPGQGRPDDRREATAGSRSVLRRCRRGQRRALAWARDDAAEPEQGSKRLRDDRLRHGRAGLRRGQLGGQGQDRRLVGGSLLGRRLLGRRLLVCGKLGRRLLGRRQLRDGFLGRYHLGHSLVGGHEPRQRLLGGQRGRRNAPAQRRRDRRRGPRGDPRRHPGSLTSCPYSGSPVRGNRSRVPRTGDAPG